VRLAGVAEVRFTTRRDGDLGTTAVSDPRIAESRSRLAEELGLSGIAAGRQVHGTRVATVTEPPTGYRVGDEADGQATALSGVGVAVHAADCLPIAIAGAGGVVMLHGGWRGLADGIIERGVEALRLLGVDGPLEAAIGPGAGGCCYQVGDEVLERFAGFEDGGRLDLKAFARARLERAGVGVVHDAGVCTLCAAPGEFYSYRRDGPSTGRQAGVAWLL
jgi:hypothetical protein